jgi:hypothetical protein
MTEKGEQGGYSRRQPIPHRSDTCPPRTCRGLNSSWGMWAARSRAPRSPGSTGIPRRCTTHDQSSSLGTKAACSRCHSIPRCTRMARNRNRLRSASTVRRRSGIDRDAEQGLEPGRVAARWPAVCAHLASAVSCGALSSPSGRVERDGTIVSFEVEVAHAVHPIQVVRVTAAAA